MASRWDDGACSSSAPRWRYDVFLSFRGEDTRTTFLDHLYSALRQKGIHTFKDDEELRKGKEISPALLEAIEDSKSAIIIFSKEYASSSWCLNELAKIIDCLEEKKIQKIVPVFYHVQPSEVRHQSGSFAAAFANHERVFGENGEKVQKWRAALVKAANINGHPITPNDYESGCIQEIVGDILSDLVPTFSIVNEDLVGIESRVEKLNSLLSIRSNDIRIIGIWGLGGIGKTTIAQAVFNQSSYQFEGRSFLQNVREVSRNHGVQHLQEKLISDVLGQNEKVQNVREGINMIKNRLHNKRVLVVLDDVDHLGQINSLAGKHDWFGLGSRIIITTRDKHLLHVDAIYEVSLLNNDEAIRLFSMNAFKLDHPTKEYEKLSYDVVHYAGGLPLALKVLGSFLFGRDTRIWRSAVDSLKDVPEEEILEKLKISYDGLRDIEKEIFLDIACFFHLIEDSVIRILDSFDFHAKIGIRVLIEKCLIIDSYGRPIMHDLIRDMGRHIVCGGYRNEPEKWSRLWRLEDVRNVLKENMGPTEVEAIILDLEVPEKVNFSTEAFIKMNKLRLLKFRNVIISQGIEFLPNKLRWLDWNGYPSKSLPTSFQAENLVGLIMCYSNIVKLWRGTLQLKKLKLIDLSHSHKLIRTPDFTGIPNLETLILEDCTSLVELHPSVGFLTKLSFVNLRNCKSVKSLPRSIQLPSLEILILSSCSKLGKFPEICGNMEHLSELYLDGTAIKGLPSSIEHLTNLSLIDLRNCENLRTLSSGICMLKHIRTLPVSGCSRLDKLPENLGEMEGLGELFADGTAMKELPSSIEQLTSLVLINLRNCKSLTSLPETIYQLKCLKTLILSGCSKLDKLPENFGDMECLEELHVDGTAIMRPPSSIGRLKNLKVLSFCKFEGETHQSKSSLFLSWILPIKYHDFIRLVLPSLSGLSLSTKLKLSGCNMFEAALPNDLGNLSSLEVLNLSGRNFVNLPESINQLSRLEILKLVGCKNLEALPKLPSNIAKLYADECQSLKTLTDLSMNNKLFMVSLINCLKLLQNKQSENLSNILLQCGLQRLIFLNEGYSLFFPGTEIPQWFSHQNIGCTVSMQLPPHWFPQNLMGVA
ncbi:hypothetical protein F0562_030697 [Nyssa sinensis]|uniref:ADP-ribosyl cyclase/cyclic ADP-ribose hydrolase n=1 Tax=Nyssa sinensis TaxID=561372 RepID=A0A5J5AZ24_9ASTE|nr:hypothetical protein F0562_030697 [Nyssa sinensis]